MRASLLIALLALAFGSAQALAQEPKTTLPDVEDEVMCPVCGTTLELASEAPQANRQREFIRELIDQGYTKEEIKDALVAEFGPEVLALPGDKGFDLVAWIAPALALLAAAVAIFLGLRRWRAASAAGTPEPSDAPSAPSAQEKERLEADMRRHEA